MKFSPFALAGLCALAGASHAVGPTGPTGPTGPVGLNRGATTGSASSTTTTVIDNPGGGTNRIEITGNTARNITVHCGDATSGRAGAGSVNSVHVDGKALQGRTVIVQGRNTQDIDARVDCGANANAGASRGAANVNSVNIR